MQRDFHYYATYCAAILAGYSHDESQKICYSAQLVDLCSRALLAGLKAPPSAATTQLSMEMADARTDLVGLQDITRIWASFHFLPYDLYAQKKGCPKRYLNKYRLICKPNGMLLGKTVELAKGKSLQAIGLAMHVLADTWAHSNFAGTPSLVINNTDDYFYELFPDGSERPVKFSHKPSGPDDLERGIYNSSLYQISENSIMNLGHGRAGHLPDYCFMRYKYLPAWAEYEEIVKDNPSDYLHAFCQMIEALLYLRGEKESFAPECYAWGVIEGWKAEILEILNRRQPDAEADWKAFGKKLSGAELEDFDLMKYQMEYLDAEREKKNETFLGRFILAALAQKSMVTHQIFRSGNKCAGFSVDFLEKGFHGIRDYWRLVEQLRKEGENE